MQTRYTNLETATESGVLYLVPDESGKGKRLVRKPRAPVTSAPMDEDFDAYTLATREPVTEVGTIKGGGGRPTSWVPTSPPLDEDFDAWTYTYTGGPVTGTGTIYDEEYLADSEDGQEELENGRDGGGNEGPESRSRTTSRLLRRRKGRKVLGRNNRPLTISASIETTGSGNRENGVSAEPNENGTGHAQNGYANGNQYYHRRNRETREGSLSLVPSSSKSEANRRLGAGQGRSKGTKSGTALNGNGKHRNGTRGDAKTRRRNEHTRQTISQRGPVAHDYEVVDSRVLEEGPERTVTISTWREKVANEARRSEVEMSVYYLNADDYVVDPEREEFRESLASKRSKKGKEKQKDLLNDGWTRSQPVYYRSSSSLRAYTPWPSGATNLADITGESSSSTSKTKVKNRGSTRSSLRMEWTDHEYVEPRTSTPVQRRKPNGVLTQETAGHEGGASRSTSSTMRVEASAPALETLLSSCEPSLLYLTPLLVGLGIKTKEHMRAIGRLREETRNKEVREEALKRGMTVMEWAILLDKLQQNG